MITKIYLEIELVFCEITITTIAACVWEYNKCKWVHTLYMHMMIKYDVVRVGMLQDVILWVFYTYVHVQGGPKKNNTENMSNIHNKLNTCISSNTFSLSISSY